MKTPVTVRTHSELLADARHCAREENRTLTNFIETVLRQRIKAAAVQAPASSAKATRTGDKPTHAA